MERNGISNLAYYKVVMLVIVSAYYDYDLYEEHYNVDFITGQLPQNVYQLDGQLLKFTLDVRKFSNILGVFWMFQLSFYRIFLLPLFQEHK